MEYLKTTIEVPSMTFEEWDKLSEEQKERLMELKRKLKQYEDMLRTFRRKVE